jgi:mRNA (guanine-N7-)-methyltransferase
VKAKGQDDPTIFYKNFPDEVFFDVISAQFCMHYFFENESSVRNFLENISKRLVKGGYFISTFPDWKVLL